MQTLVRIKEYLFFSSYLTKSKYYDNSNKLIADKMNNETAGVAIEEFVGLNSNMHSFLVYNEKALKSKGRE